MLKSYVCEVNCWGGHNIIHEIVVANDPNKAKQKARDTVRNRIKAPADMVKVTSVELYRGNENDKT